MKIKELKPGKYVLALSGGVDSVVLLDILSRRSSVELVLAHYNHGIRVDSYKDEVLVKALAKSYDLPLEITQGNLGAKASEELARQKRYDFLNSVSKKYKANGIITAHHQDDLIETAFLNLLRGTSYRGLTAIYLNPNIERPLIKVPKRKILEYAATNRLQWREDSTNQDTIYVRNYIRKYIMPKLSQQNRKKLLIIIEKVAKTQDKLEKEIATILQKNNNIDRMLFTSLPFEVGNELIAQWLRQNSQNEFETNTLERLNTALRLAKKGANIPVKRKNTIKIGQKEASLTEIA